MRPPREIGTQEAHVFIFISNVDIKNASQRCRLKISNRPDRPNEPFMKDTHIACTMSLPLKYWEGVKYYFTDFAHKELTNTLLNVKNLNRH